MRPLIIAKLGILILLTACSSSLSQQDIQTAIAQTQAAMPATPTIAPTDTPDNPTAFPPTWTPAMEPTETLKPTSNVFWPQTTEEGNQIIKKILSALSSAGIQSVDVTIYTDVSDLNTLLGRPHQYIAKAAWRDPSIAAEGEASVDNGGSIEVFLTSSDLQARYKYIDALSSSIPMFAEYDYQNAPAFIRLSKSYLPSRAQKIADIFLALKFKGN